MILKLGMDYLGLKVYKVYRNDDHWLTLTYFKARSNLVEIAYCADTSSRYQVSIYVNFCPLVLTLWVCSFDQIFIKLTNN